MKKVIRFLGIFLGVCLLLGGVVIYAVTMHYRNNFAVNTWINGVYCTGKSIDQVNQELVGRQEPFVITVVDADSEAWEIDTQAAGIRPDFRDALQAYVNQTSDLHWIDNLRSPEIRELAVEQYILDEEKLRACLEKLPFVQKEQEKADGVKIRKSEEGFVLEDGNAQRLDLEKAYAYLKDCVLKGEDTVDLLAGECYTDLADDLSDQKKREIWEKVSHFSGNVKNLIYDMGAEEIALTPAISSGFLRTRSNGCPALDVEGNLVLDEEAVRGWVQELVQRYDTWGTEKDFNATRGEVVKVKYVTYGTKLDGKAEEEYLLERLKTELTNTERSRTERHVPVYSKKGYARGLDDIGGTYVEIDMTEQRMYYYVDGRKTLETDIVTGNMSRRMNTPQGINFVYLKQRNRTLRGPGYASFVKYWVPVKGNIGIHDASWRSEFGGEIYKTSGSHGCINTPTEVMSKLYETVEVGTPVVMFY